LRIEVKGYNNPKINVINDNELIDGKYLSKGEITYRRINFKYYPVVIRKTGTDPDASLKVQGKDGHVVQYSESVFLLTQCEDEDFLKIKAKNVQEKDKNLSNNESPYNKQFWDNYNTILLDQPGLPKFEDFKP